jgi:serine protease Do
MLTRGAARAAVMSRDNRLPALWLTAIAVLALCLAPLPGYARTAPDSFADLVEKLTPTVVNISTTQTVKRSERPGGEVPIPQFPPGSPFEEFFKDFFERQRPENDTPRRRQTSLGSGFIIDPSGIVITNNHVIAEADEITVTLSDDTKHEAEVIGRDQKTDIAVLKIKTDKPLTAANWGNSDKSRVGDWVIAIGNPFGLGGTVTAGIISARQRDINAGPYDDFLQTDASINRGNSGGPMFNLDGDVIGINTAIFSPSGGSIGIGFAIPSTLAKSVVNQLQKYGRTKRGWLGVRIQTVTDEIAESLGLEDSAGALVADVTEDSPAATAGVEAGDVILTFDGRPVEEMRVLPRMVADTEIGREVKVEVWRKGETKTLKVTLGELEEAEQLAALQKDKEPGRESPAQAEALGMTLARITPELRQRFDLGEEAEGVVITEIDGESAAAEKGIRPGDIIVEVGQEEVSTPGEVAEKVRSVEESQRKSVLLLLQRAGDLRFVAVRVGQS